MPALTKLELWQNLEQYHFNDIVPPNAWNRITELFGGEDASTKAFADKIKRKHQWGTNFAMFAIHEYKKFVYLGVISNFQVTPSKVIDVVWHEHLLFTKPYRDFCENIIQHNFDHHPELIPIDEQTEQFAEQYVKTLLLYRTEFGKDAPVEIWSLPKFNDAQLKRARKVYTGDSTGLSTDWTSDNAPLASNFESSNFSDFEGGDFGGGGAGGDYGDSSDSSDGGSDGSSCSSGCGGGCGGD
ncbi:MAG: glycine-rich domain-containing protein [Lacibacter sp.]